MRVLGRNILEIKDPFTDSIIEIQYRIPSTSERVHWHGAIGEAVTSKKPQLLWLVEYGREMIAGVGTGSFGIDDENGESIPVDSEPSSINYDPEWKDKLFYPGSPNEDFLGLLGKWLYTSFMQDRYVKKK